MMARKGSQQYYKKLGDKCRKSRYGEILGETTRKEYYEEKALRDSKNREALLYFIRCLNKVLTPEEQANAKEVFKLWEERKYNRTPSLAHTDLKGLIPAEKLDKCQVRLQLYLELNK